MFNVFKRPMFKRGGPSKGTGIMSHVESKNIGGGVIKGEPMGSRTGFAAPFPGMEYYGEPTGPVQTNLPRSQIGLKKTRFPFLKTQFIRPVAAGAFGTGAIIGTGLGSLVDFYARSTYTPEGYRRLKEVSEYAPFDETATSEDILKAQEYIEEGRKIGTAPGFFPRGGKKKFYEDRGLSAETGLPRDPFISPTQEMKEQEMAEGFAQAELDRIAAEEKAEEEKEIAKAKQKESTYTEGEKTTVEKEIETLNDILGPAISKGEKALLIGKAISTPGSFSDKLDVARDEALKLGKEKRKRDRDIALTAYRVAKEKEKAEIMAGKKGETERLYDEYADLSVKTERTPKEEAKFNALKNKLEKTDEGEALLKAFAGKAYDPGRVRSLRAQISVLETKKSLSDLEKQDLEKKKSELREQLYYQGKLGIPEFKTGGRVMKQVGGSMNDNSITSVENVTQDQVEPTKTVQTLSYAELRDRLPKEITNDIVQLIAASERALQDFAYIRTQQDINDFNAKYGVNLVLPASAT